MGNTQIVEILLNHNANVNAASNNGQTALILGKLFKTHQHNPKVIINNFIANCWVSYL